MMMTLVWIILTIVVFKGALWLYRKTKSIALTPLLIAPAIIIVILILFNIPATEYETGGKWITFLIEPATIALAVTLYKHFDLLKKHALVIVSSVLVGAIIALITSVGLATLFGLSVPLIDSLAPRSVTASIAMPIADRLGGIPTITAISTIITGVISMVIGPIIMKWLHINTPLSRGILLGTSSHASGISKAFEYDHQSGSIATVAMLITAFITVGVAPWFVTIIINIVG